MPQPISTTLKYPSLSALLTPNTTGLVKSGFQTTTPAAAVFKPNTDVNIAYGGKSSVPTGAFTSNPTAGFAGTTPSSTPTLPKAPEQPLAVAQPGASTVTPPPPTTSTPTTGNIVNNQYTVNGVKYDAHTGQPVQTGGVAAPTTPETPTGTPGLFSSVVGSLAGRATQPSEAYTAGQQKYNQISQQIADVGLKGAKAGAGYQTTGTTPVAEGNAAVIARTTAAQQQALGTQQQAALTSAQAGQTQQGLEQSALGTAAGLTAPQASFPFVFDPATGVFKAVGATGGSSVGSLTYNPNTDSQTLAQAVMDRKISYNDALNALSYAGNISSGLLSTAVIGLGGNPTNLQAQATGAASTIGGVPALESANTAAEGIKNAITSYITANPQLNPSDLAAGNLLTQWVQGKQLTDPKYQTLFNYLNEYTNTLAPILGVGGNPTNLKTEIAQGFINAAASGKSITEVLNSMSKLATDKIANIKSGATGGGVVTSPSTSGGLYSW